MAIAKLGDKFLYAWYLLHALLQRRFRDQADQNCRAAEGIFFLNKIIENYIAVWAIRYRLVR